jgi:hypothetical protein
MGVGLKTLHQGRQDPYVDIFMDMQNRTKTHQQKDTKNENLRIRTYPITQFAV